jgi:lysophospholipase L1-like esterase
MKARRLGIIAIAGAVIFLCYRSVLPPPAVKNQPGAAVYTFLGDSLTQGNAIPPPAYPEIAGRILGGKANNLGITGLTTLQILLAELHAVPPDTQTAVIYAGTNDLTHELVYRFALPHWVTQTAYRFMIDALQRNGVKTYTVLLRDLARMPGYDRDPQKAAEITAWTNSWDSWIARQGGLPIDLRCFADMNDPANYRPDGLHPNARGTRLLAEHVAQGIKNGGVTCAATAP